MPHALPAPAARRRRGGGRGARLALACLAALCAAPAALPADTAAAVTSTPLTVDPRACTGRFEVQPLAHYTRGPDEFIGFFDSNGAGAALADLDQDGRIDIVLAGLHGATSLLWNEGDLFFRRGDLPAELTRGVNAVDVDGDAAIDLVFTHSGGLPSWWRSVAGADGAAGADAVRPTFVRMEDERFRAWFPAYSMAWADLDVDGDLDLVGASYDAELGALSDGMVVGGGVFFYRNDGTGLLTFERLGRRAHALALLLTDLNDDGRRDILIGNDFSPPDVVYLNTPDGWREAAPFSRTPVNTMSFAEGDLDNDGRTELLATDMKPYQRGDSTAAEWGPLWAESAHLQPNDGVQVTANVLHARSAADGASFVDAAEAAGVDATGWSWSAQFGDLDNDGYLDLYVVNGMIAAEVFSHLPGDELVEENQALRNTGDGRFRPAPEWGLNATQSGRGMSLGDLDNDGDLDVVVNNLAAPALLFENRLCGGASLQVELRQEGVANSRAVGAVLRLHTAGGTTLLREMRASSGYLSSDPARVHFGLGAAGAGDLEHLEVVWPDGAASRVAVPAVNVLLRVTRPAAGT